MLISLFNGAISTELCSVRQLDWFMYTQQVVEWKLAGGTEILGKITANAALSTINPTWPGLGSIPGRRYGKMVSICMGYDTSVLYNLAIDSVVK
jgi:hypothetical protein